MFFVTSRVKIGLLIVLEKNSVNIRNTMFHLRICL